MRGQADTAWERARAVAELIELALADCADLPGDGEAEGDALRTVRLCLTDAWSLLRRYEVLRRRAAAPDQVGG
jgi:hypothetical protein